MKSFLVALRFMTTIPIGKKDNFESEAFVRSTAYFPLVGLIVGALNLLVFWAVSKFSAGLFPFVCVAAFNAVVTGALHIDGLADTCDGIFSSRTRERMVEIMTDSRVGVMGAIAIVLDFASRITLTPSINAILIAPVISRCMMTTVLLGATPAEPDAGAAKTLVGSINWLHVLVCNLITAAITFAVVGIKGLPIYLGCIIFSFLYRKFIYHKLGGLNGDTLGALNELVEILVYFLWIQLK